MKIIKKIILWTSLFVVPIGLVTPMINYSVSNNNKNYIESYNLENVEQKLNIINNSLNQQQQINLFKGITIEDILSEISNKNSVLYQNIKAKTLNNNFENKNVYEEINKNIDYFKEIAQNVLDGKLATTEIKQNLINYKNNNLDKYNNLINEIGISINDIENINNDLKIEKFAYSNEEFKKINDVTIIDDENNTITITSDQLAFFTKAEKFLSRLQMYRDKTYGVAIVSATLTAASWAIAAFYWSAWWMFGANVPFALAATVQAGLATWTTTENFNEYYKAKDDVEKFEEVINNNEFKDYKILSEELLKESQKTLSNNAIDFTIFLSKFTTFPYLLSKLINWGIKKMWNSMSKKLSNLTTKFLNVFSSFKSVLNQINKRISNFLIKVAEKKIAMKAVSWASPAGSVINALDIVLNICSFASDIAIFNPRELSSW